MDRIEDAIADFKEGKFVIVVDDEDRENEGDLLPLKNSRESEFHVEAYARGVLCAPVTVSRCKELDLPHQVVTILPCWELLLRLPLTTGRLQQLFFHWPLLLFRRWPILLHRQPFGRRPGPTSIRYMHKKKCRADIQTDWHGSSGRTLPGRCLDGNHGEDGTMARLPELRQMADEHGLKLISIHDLIVYRLETGIHCGKRSGSKHAYWT